MNLKSSSNVIDLNNVSGETNLMKYITKLGGFDREYYVINLLPGMNINMGRISNQFSVVEITEMFLREFNNNYDDLIGSSGYGDVLNEFLYQVDNDLLESKWGKVYGLYKLEERIKNLIKEKYPQYIDKINSCETIRENLMVIYKTLKVYDFESTIIPYESGMFYVLDTRKSSINTYKNDVTYHGIKWSELKEHERSDVNYALFQLDNVGCDVISNYSESSTDVIYITINCNVEKIYNKLISVIEINEIL